MKRALAIFVLLLSVQASGMLHAERYAVLVGVSHYAIGKAREHVDLEGPDNDVPALRSKLLDAGFAPGHITTLLDAEAKHASILAALQETVTRAKPGDLVLFYFSGHGTSSFDRGNRSLAADIGPNSGALLPYDLDLTSSQTVLQSILIGRRDLRPILARLNPGARALVILDACYSQDSSKDVTFRGDPRSLDVGALMDSREVNASKGDSVASIETAMLAASSEEPYPYSNVVSLAASSRDETASDMSSRFLAVSPVQTVDRRPHGAFTNSLLKGLGGAADTDHNGTISVDELFRYAREDMRPNFKQTPQVLEPGGSLGGSLARAMDLGLSRENGPLPPAGSVPHGAPAGSVSEGTPGSAPSANAVQGRGRTILLKTEQLSPDLKERLLQLPGVVESYGTYDLLVRRTAYGYDVFNAASTLLASLVDGDTEGVVRRVGAERELTELVDARPVRQDFNLDLDIARPRHVGSIQKGQHLSVVMNSSQPAYLLLFDIDPTGRITVLYPGNDAESNAVASGREVELLDGIVRPPLGAEYLKLLAFREKPEGYDQWQCKPAPNGRTRCLHFEPGSEEFRRLMDLLHQPGSGRSQALLRVTTTE